MIPTIQIQECLEQLKASSDRSAWDFLEPLANLTALRREEPDGYFISNFWRGPLLYALVQALRPKNVLELGTGRGYSTMAMARAALDASLNTNIWSVDGVPIEQDQGWHYDSGNGATTESVSLKTFWATHIPSDLTDQVTVVTGDCADVANSWSKSAQPPVDLVFIDAGHTYPAVKRDFLAALTACAPDATFVFDDYGDRSDYGVKRLIDRYLPSRVSESEIQVIEFPFYSAYDKKRDHKMAIWSPSGNARPETFSSFLNSDQLFMSTMRRARRIKAAIRKVLPGQ